MLKVGMAGIGGISGAHIPAWEAMEERSLRRCAIFVRNVWKSIRTSIYIRIFRKC